MPQNQKEQLSKQIWRKLTRLEKAKTDRFIVIGLTGYAKSGKDTIASLLPDYRRVAFADTLKADILWMLRDVIPKDKPSDQWLEENKDLLRPLLVEYGRAKRAFDPMYWVSRTAKENGMLLLARGRFVLTDVRYLNEVAWLKGYFPLVYIFRIWREGVGPANEEEARSIKEIVDSYPDIETIYNPEGAPEEAAQRIMDIVEPPINAEELSFRRSERRITPRKNKHWLASEDGGL